MNSSQPHKGIRRRIWREANVRLLPSGIVSIIGATISHDHGKVLSGSFDNRIIAALGLILFIIFATAFLQVLTKAISRQVSVHHLSVGRAAAMQFVLRTLGYTAIFLTTLDLLGIPVGKLLLGGAAIGIILGVAAQQALANLFASFVLIIAHPFSVGQHVTIVSGGLGGKYVGVIKDIGLTHTKLSDEDGNRVLLPNAALLSSAAVVIVKPIIPSDPSPDNQPAVRPVKA